MLRRVSDIFWMVMGVVLLVLELTGATDIGVWGFVGAAACIGIGLLSMRKMRMDRRALKSELLQDGRVINFYKTTQAAWFAGELSALHKGYRKEGKLPYRRFVKRYLPVEGSALFAFFSQFPPREGEFLVSAGSNDSVKNANWCVLTSHRLILKDGRDGSFKTIPLSKVDTFEMRGSWTRTLRFVMTSGKTVVFEKVEVYPSKKFLTEMVNRAKAAQQGATDRGQPECAHIRLSS